MGSKEKVLEMMKKVGKPLSGGELEKLTGLDKSEIDKAMNQLKKEDLIESPIRCKWQPK